MGFSSKCTRIRREPGATRRTRSSWICSSRCCCVSRPSTRSQRAPTFMADLDLARTVLETEARAILDLVPRVNHQFDKAVALLLNCHGRVILTGMGKSGLICRKIAATLTSTGTPAHFLHPAEAIHGDLGMI